MSDAVRMLTIIFLLAPALQFVGGCGSDETPNKNFYTSGNKEADERADQRMAEAQQLKGGSGDSPLGGAKKSLFERLGSMDGVQAITDDWVTRMLADPRVNFTRHGVVQGGLSIH